MRFEYEDYCKLRRGIVVFVCLCGFPALELNGFGIGFPITVPIAMASVVIGGAAGGTLICPRPLSAGLIAGLSGFLAVYYDVKFRQNFWVLELTLVQAIARTPGWLIGYLLKNSLSTTSSISPRETNLFERD